MHSAQLPTEWDVIVVGAGSAGCVVAARLSEDPSLRVLLLEAGGPDRSPVIHIPGLVPQAIGSRTLNWHYQGEADATLGGRQLTWAAGRTLGGGSAINGMVFVRGLPAGFDGWAAAGATGWGWADLLPYFRRMEHWAHEAGPARGQGGPLQVRRQTETNAAVAAWIDAAVATGTTPYVADHNTGITEGVSLNQGTQARGLRCSTAVAYLRPARQRPNLHIVTGALVQRLVLQQGRCVGVQVRVDGALHTWHARREVVLSAGAIASPKLLMLSGIGEPAHLREHGIAVQHALPGVGMQLNEHVNLKLSVRTSGRTYSSERKGWRKAVNGARWLLRRDGPAASPVGHAQAFLRTDPALASADVQVQLMPMGFDKAFDAGCDAMSSVISLCAPRTRGRITLRSADPRDPPHIRIPLLAVEADVRTLAAACDMVRGVHAAAARGGQLMEELSPGPAEGGSVAAWRRALETYGALNWHPTSTCRMGDGPLDVVDTALRVHGLDGLRVIDCSVMPSVPAGNTNAPVIAMAEKAADLIAGRPTLAPAALSTQR